MAYCSKCGKKNDDDARFCNKCGADLASPHRYQERAREREREDKCEEECSGKRNKSAWTNFWIIILALVALGIVLSIIFRFIRADMPHWMRSFEYWDIFGLLVGLVVVIFIIYLISESRKKE